MVVLPGSRLRAVLTIRGIAYRTEAEEETKFVVLGIAFHFPFRAMTNTPARAWRLYYSLGALVRLRRSTGEAMRIVAGHLCHFCMIHKEFLAILVDI